MFDLISLISIALAIAALASVRGARARLDTEIAALKDELKRIEALRGGPVAQDAASVDTAETGQVQDAAAKVAEQQDTEQQLEKAAREQAAAETPVTAAPEATPSIAETAAGGAAVAEPAKPGESLESRLAARWTVWVGGLALAFAGIFAVKYSIDQGLLSPAVRLSLAALFGLVLMVAGEVLRRRTALDTAKTFANAMIPGVLTAAGSLTLFGAVFGAHEIYAYIGPATTFLLLCVISLATLALSLLHGQGLAGLGLVASFVTPALVHSDHPSPWPLFGFLSIAWIAGTLASKLRRWRVTPAIANAGLAGWGILYVMGAQPFQVLPVVLTMLIMIAGLAFIWPGRWISAPTAIAPELSEDETAEGGVPESRAPEKEPAKVTGPWEMLLVPPQMASTLVAAIGVTLTAVVFLAPDLFSSGYIFPGFVVLTIALALFGAARNHAIYPAIFSAIAALGGLNVVVAATATSTFATNTTTAAKAPVYFDPVLVTWIALGLGAFFAVVGIVLNLLRRGEQSPHTIVWSVIATVTPLALATVSFVYFGNYFFDLKHGLFAILLGLVYLAAAFFTFRSPPFDGRYVFTRDLFVAASWASLLYALLVMTNDAPTTVGAAILGFVYLLAGRAKAWPSLPWAMAAAAIFVAGRIAWEPTIVGVTHLSRTPVFNALLLGYGVPSLLLILSAWLMRRSPDLRIRSVLEALASLFALLTIAILVRHAMNGGVLNDATPTLGEQSIYTLLTIGASVTLMALDLRQPSIVFRTGSMAVGYISMAFVIFVHYVGLNPYLTGEPTGRIPVFNLLFLAYLLPGMAYGFAALFARHRRPLHYVIALALTGASLLFAYVSLTVRRTFHGADISQWKGFLQPELYTYSVVWLLLGVVLLVIGYRFRAKSLRIASAALVLIAVVKVFLVDMANLEGLFRVLSFIGLGVALIGIGRFYQTILTGLNNDVPKQDIPTPSSTPQAEESGR
jgi:uncharacterized membrane protein